jgi:hypothetical protein
LPKSIHANQAKLERRLKGITLPPIIQKETIAAGVAAQKISAKGIRKLVKPQIA